MDGIKILCLSPSGNAIPSMSNNLSLLGIYMEISVKSICIHKFVFFIYICMYIYEHTRCMYTSSTHKFAVVDATYIEVIITCYCG